MSKQSLTQHLIAWALGTVVVVWASFIAFGYWTGVIEAGEIADGHLTSVAALMLEQAETGFPSVSRPQGPPGFQAVERHEYQQDVSVVVWNAAGDLLLHIGKAPAPPFSTKVGFENLVLGPQAGAWRAYSRWSANGANRVSVLVSLGDQDELARDITGHMIDFGLWLLPVIALALGLAIRRGLRPLHELSRDIHALDIHKAQPLPAQVRYKEFRATVDAINTLVARYHSALTRERALANEFAHELRTPLASLSLQTRALRDLSAGPERENTLVQLERDVLRAGEVLSHLLALARASRVELDETKQATDVTALASQVVAAFAPAAHENRQELALGSPGPFVIMGHPLLIELALRNLVENALAHTSPGTVVEVQINPQERWVQVCDSGPDLACPSTAKKVSVMHSLGLGLGHRVVEKIITMHGGRLEQVTPPGGFSTCYRLTFGV